MPVVSTTVSFSGPTETNLIKKALPRSANCGLTDSRQIETVPSIFVVYFKRIIQA